MQDARSVLLLADGDGEHPFIRCTSVAVEHNHPALTMEPIF
jgi:hypothetical protein